MTFLVPKCPNCGKTTTVFTWCSKCQTRRALLAEAGEAAVALDLRVVDDPIAVGCVEVLDVRAHLNIGLGVPQLDEAAAASCAGVSPR